MGLPNRQLDELDELIEGALKQGAAVSQTQKQFAWERLSYTVQYQTILPAAVTVAERSIWSRLTLAGGILWRQFSALAVEEDRYKLASHKRYMTRYQGIAQANEMVMQFL